MVDGLLQPLNIFILGLGGGFLIPLLYRIAKPLPAIAFVLALGGMAVISGVCFWSLRQGAPAIEILTAGGVPPFTINLRFGLWEGFFALMVNIAAVLGAWHLWERLRSNYAALLLYLILVMGIDGLIMTRDLFNLFVFLEISSIATYGLLGLERNPAALAASFKYIMATVLASSFFLLGAVLLYYVTGTLNIDDMIEHRAAITGPIGLTALLFVLSCLIVELKPFPANGWGLDVYETAPGGVAALVSVGVSAGVFFALMKLLPLFENQLGLLAVSGGVTFLLSNLVGLRQTKVQRMLGYSSIAQMGLLLMALASLQSLGATASLPLVVGGLFVNHLFAKAGLFWLAGTVERENIDGWSAIARRPVILFVFAMLLVAIAGLPPFPGFWAKWELVMQLAAGGKYVAIVAVLAGSLLEAAYMFRWFKQATRPQRSDVPIADGTAGFAPAIAAAILLAAGGWIAADLAGAASLRLFLPLFAGAVLYLLDWLPGRVKCLLMLAAVLFFGGWQIDEMTGQNQLFAVLLLAGGLVIASASLYRSDARPGFYPLMAILLLAIIGLLRSVTSLEFLFSWELITLSSYFLIIQGRDAHPHAPPFLLFSLFAAFCILSGFAMAAAGNGTISLAALGAANPGMITQAAFVLLGVGFLIKAGAVGVHVWLPGTYAEADDDLSAMLSAVVSKVAIIGLFLVTYLAIRASGGLEMSHAVAWIGLLTTIAGATMALAQNDMKRMLAYSSMSQLGYIVTAIALMSHLGWVTAFYLIANHMLVKGILFLAIAGVILRTGIRNLDESGGLARAMPFTFAAVVVALISMSGLPPLVGFGGKWLLLNAMIQRGWYWLAAVGVAATFMGFLYMFQLAFSVFLGARKPGQAAIREAPATLLVPQYLLIAGILVLSFFPKLLMEPVSAAIDPQFASTLVWQGMSLEAIYEYWNPARSMTAALVIAGAALVAFWLVYKIRRNKADADGVRGFYRFYQPTWIAFASPVANAFWDGVSGTAVGAAGVLRKVYTGDGQTYALYVLYYVVAVYMAATFHIL